MKKAFCIFTLAMVVYVLACAPIRAAANDSIVNDAALNLKRPEYPAEARAAKIGGAVKVKITVNNQGKVVDAQVISGHPSLAESCQKAALESTFSVKKMKSRTGIIIYNFRAK